MWVGLLISYVANVENVACDFCLIFMRKLFYFYALLNTQMSYLCTEFQSAMKSNQLIN